MFKYSSYWFATIIFCITSLSIASPEQEASIFVQQASPNQAPPNTEQGYNDRIQQQYSGFARDNQDNQITLKNIQNMYEENLDQGLKNSDPIQHNLNMHRLQQQPNVTQDTENLLRQRERWHINENDSIFSRSNLHSENSKIVTCRQGAKGVKRSCTRKRTITLIQNSGNIKNITISVTGSLIKGALLSVDLKTGAVSALKAQDLSVLNYNHTDEMYASLNFLYTYYPALVEPTNLSAKADDLFGSENYHQALSIQNSGFVKHSNSNASIRQIIFEEPSASNQYIAKIGLVHWYYIYSQNPWYDFGFDVSWKVTIPPHQQPDDTWEGCEILASNTNCKEVESKPLELNESRKISGYSTPITRSHWAEEKSYICGMGTSTNECDTIDTEKCEQIHSRCAIGNESNCIEFEQTFHCGKKTSHSGSGLELGDAATSLIEKSNKDMPLDAYDAAEFGIALTQFSAAKAMNSPMQDNLGGITGSSTNPSIFHGQCRRCTVTLGSTLKDCCYLKGIAQGLLGGCKEEEKQLATAEVKDKRCHKVAHKYCTHKALDVCLEKKEAYCCYGSQIAKIIQEIAHEQLGIPWGDGENPNCVSLTADQLSRLSFDSAFAKSKLSNLLSDYQATAQDKTNQVESKVASNDVNAKVAALQKDLAQRFRNQRS